MKRASSWIFHHPGDASYLALRKLMYMWGIYPFWNGMSQTVMGNVPTLGLSLLGAAALIRFRRYLRELSIFWTLPVFVSLVALISWGSWRFREPGDLGLIVLAAALPWASEVTRSLAVGSAAEAPDEFVNSISNRTDDRNNALIDGFRGPSDSGVCMS